MGASCHLSLDSGSCSSLTEFFPASLDTAPRRLSEELSASRSTHTKAVQDCGAASGSTSALRCPQSLPHPSWPEGQCHLWLWRLGETRVTEPLKHLPLLTQKLALHKLRHGLQQTAWTRATTPGGQGRGRENEPAGFSLAGWGPGWAGEPP